jgi:predicted alpha/beta-fold hydrolase
MINTPFQPCRWIANGHLQTLAGALLPRTWQQTQLEHLPMAQGDVLEMHSLDAPTNDAPILLLIHGLEGSVYSSYIQGMLQIAKQHQWRAIIPHLSGRHNQTRELVTILHHLHARYPQAPFAAVGYSLGGNLLLKFLGENPKQDFIHAAVGVSVPFDLEATVKKLGTGLGKLYEKNFVNQLKKTVRQKVDAKTLREIKTIYDFDDKVTAPLYQFLNAKDYYEKTSCIHFLPHIKTPTLIINAKDDPMIPEHTIPSSQQVSKDVILDIQQYGGHVGFISCKSLGKFQYWLEERIPPYLNHLLDLKKSCSNAVLCDANTPPSIDKG